MRITVCFSFFSKLRTRGAASRVPGRAGASYYDRIYIYIYIFFFFFLYIYIYIYIHTIIHIYIYTHNIYIYIYIYIYVSRILGPNQIRPFDIVFPRTKGRNSYSTNSNNSYSTNSNNSYCVCPALGRSPGARKPLYFSTRDSQSR